MVPWVKLTCQLWCPSDTWWPVNRSISHSRKAAGWEKVSHQLNLILFVELELCFVSWHDFRFSSSHGTDAHRRHESNASGRRHRTTFTSASTPTVRLPAGHQSSRLPPNARSTDVRHPASDPIPAPESIEYSESSSTASVHAGTRSPSAPATVSSGSTPSESPSVPAYHAHLAPAAHDAKHAVPSAAPASSASHPRHVTPSASASPAAWTSSLAVIQVLRLR